MEEKAEFSKEIAVLPTKPTLSLRTSSAGGRPGSIFGSLRSFKSLDDFDDPGTATSGHAPSEHYAETSDSAGRSSNNVLCHGEVQTSSSMFRKRREYLVLTETHIYKLKSQQTACEMFSQ